MRAARILVLVMLACSACSAHTTERVHHPEVAHPDISGFARCGGVWPDDCASGTPTPPQTTTIGFAGTLPSINPLTVGEGSESIASVVDMIAPRAFMVMPDGITRYNKDLFVEEPTVISTSPQTVVYKIQARARWADGIPISAADYIYNWRVRTAQAHGCRGPYDEGYSQITAVTGSDNGKTVTVAFATTYPDWRQLFNTILPSHVAATVGDITTVEGLAASCKAWSTRLSWSGGPYTVTTYEPNQQIELLPNEAWYGSVPPHLAKIVFRYYPDRQALTNAWERREIDAFDRRYR